MSDDGPDPPGGKPIPGVTNLGDVEWALTRARRYVFNGGDNSNPAYLAYVDVWLDYRLAIEGTSLEKVGTGRLHTMGERVAV